MTKEKITKYYESVCKDLKTEIYPIKFKNVGKGGACIVHNTKGKISHIEIDLKRCQDIEYAILHELSHQLLILKNNNFTHNKTFINTQNRLIDKYMYTKFSEVLWKN